MDVVHPRCAGVDISKKDAKVCVRIQGRGNRRTSSTVTTWGAMTNQILALREHLLEQKVTCVVMEATSNYWRPFYYLLEEHLEVMLVNARDVKTVPGRKSDVSDAAWLADLGAHGLVRASFVPPEPIRVLRDLTRARTTITHERTREIQRLEKLLEDTGIKLSSVATDITGVSGRLMLEALIDGRNDPVQLSQLAKGRLRSKIPVFDRGPDRALQRPPRVHDPAVPRPDRRPHRRHRQALGPHRRGHGTFSAGPGPADQHPGLLDDRRRDIHRRDRR